MKILFHWILKFASLVALIQFGSYSISRTWRRSPSRRRQRFENALCCGFSRSFGLDIGFGLHEGCSVTLVLCWALLHLLLNLRERWDTIDILFFLEKKERFVQGYKSSHNISVKSAKVWMTMTTHCYWIVFKSVVSANGTVMFLTFLQVSSKQRGSKNVNCK